MRYRLRFTALIALACALTTAGSSAAENPVPENANAAKLGSSEPGAAATEAASLLITPLAQQRRVFARAMVDCMGYPIEEQQDEVSAPDYAPFTAFVDAIAFDPGGYCDAYAEASQDSEIGADQLLGSGAASGSADNGSSGQYGIAGTQANSDFDVTFEIAEELTYVFSGSLRRSLSGYGGSIALLEGNGNVIHQYFFTMEGNVDFHVNGTLAPGQYRLIAQVSAEARPRQTPSAFSSYEFALAFDQPTAIEPTTWGSIKAQMR